MEWKKYETEFNHKAQDKLHWLLLEFAKIRSGRANTKIFEDILVAAYDETKIALYELANFQVVDGKQLMIRPYDQTLLVKITNAILRENLGFNPIIEANYIRIQFPPHTEETRKLAVKKIKEFLENAKVGVRNIRKDIHHKIKKDLELRKDELKDYENYLNKITKEWNNKLEQAFVQKEKELMTI